ncbi:hypothetical protein [Actinomadura coerulea]|uniref:hypothetical protein n=1 Tax=Actinomadura coerulea TaxID=46159 RepID=UPI00344776FD
MVWVTDITEHPTGEGMLYCAAVLDCFSRRIIGHSIDIRQTTKLVRPPNSWSTRWPPQSPAENPQKTPRSCTQTIAPKQFASWTYGKRLRAARADAFSACEIEEPPP